MTTTIAASHTSSQCSPLRAVLAVNAATSLSAGLVTAFAPNTISELFDLTQTRADLIVRTIGIGLCVFAVDVAVTAIRDRTATIKRDTTLISAVDIAWVIATVIVLATVDLSAAGRSIAVVMGIGVAAFAALQLGLRRHLSTQPTNHMENQS